MATINLSFVDREGVPHQLNIYTTSDHRSAFATHVFNALKLYAATHKLPEPLASIDVPQEWQPDPYPAKQDRMALSEIDGRLY